MTIRRLGSKDMFIHSISETGKTETHDCRDIAPLPGYEAFKKQFSDSFGEFLPQDIGFERDPWAFKTNLDEFQACPIHLPEFRGLLIHQDGGKAELGIVLFGIGYLQGAEGSIEFGCIVFIFYKIAAFICFEKHNPGQDPGPIRVGVGMGRIVEDLEAYVLLEALGIILKVILDKPPRGRQKAPLELVLLIRLEPPHLGAAE